MVAIDENKVEVIVSSDNVEEVETKGNVSTKELVTSFEVPLDKDGVHVVLTDKNVAVSTDFDEPMSVIPPTEVSDVSTDADVDVSVFIESIIPVDDVSGMDISCSSKVSNHMSSKRYIQPKVGIVVVTDT